MLSGYEFEGFLKLLFEKKGHTVENTPLSGDQGADLVISKFGGKIVVQTKRYNEKVANKTVQEVVASIAQYGANKGIVVTNNYFTASAVELTNSNGIELINRDTLEHLINEHPIGINEIEIQLSSF
ncbi:restriction endonuclease [Methanobacterium sp. MBAC-LM]|uniref:restriction endonuclease n=1 Tax=Methanobacterium sp. MBAC-LM TaxID=3412034 RepID=UPI003C71105C